MAASMSEKNAALKKGRVGGFGGSKAYVLLRSKFSSDVTKILKCSRWEELAGRIAALGHTTRSWQQTRDNFSPN
jgi:hypothetical protein